MARTQDGGVVHLDVAELTTVGIQFSEAVQPQGAALQLAVEIQGARPDVGVAGVFLLHGRQGQNAVALLHQAHAAAERTATHFAGVVVVGDRGHFHH